MLLVDFLRRTLMPGAKIGLLHLVVVYVWLGHAPVEAQVTSPAGTPRPTIGSATVSPLPIVLGSAPFAPQWSALSGAQQESLRPLSSTWDTLSDGHKRKWIALAKNYPAMAPAEQVKLHNRMAEWAALNPRERELARLNFVQTKKLSPPDRASKWEAYKALSPEERQKLAKKAIVKPTGAAAAIKPIPPDKLTAVPVTRHTPQLVREMANSKQSIDRNTLLPLPSRRLSGAPPSQD